MSNIHIYSITLYLADTVQTEPSCIRSPIQAQNTLTAFKSRITPETGFFICVLRNEVSAENRLKTGRSCKRDECVCAVVNTQVARCCFFSTDCNFFPGALCAQRLLPVSVCSSQTCVVPSHMSLTNFPPVNMVCCNTPTKSAERVRKKKKKS